MPRSILLNSGSEEPDTWGHVPSCLLDYEQSCLSGYKLGRRSSGS